MFTLVRASKRRGALAREGLALAAALVLADALYRFHSFALECLAFLATWLVLGAALEIAVALLRDRRHGGTPRSRREVSAP